MLGMNSDEKKRQPATATLLQPNCHCLPLRRNSTSALPANTPPVVATSKNDARRHRFLPQTPECTSQECSCSSPRFLPTIPPETSLSSHPAVSTQSYNFLSHIHQDDHQRKGRRLPQIPVIITASKNDSSDSDNVVDGFLKVSHDSNITTRRRRSTGDQINVTTGSNSNSPNINTIESEWPMATNMQRKYSQFQNTSTNDDTHLSSASFNIFGETTAQLSQLSSQHQHLQKQSDSGKLRRSRDSLDQSSGTSSSTSFFSQSSSVSPSIEQVLLNI
ncbi:unnamed protein product [Thelazia callipaeda]|uniref:Uncharacterized protein n=1 Tax=Thelazia callipaeda TaxID=103827 RepID=A0A0N5D502_THECL|nr:unnamed protein product [Thelazia callipaeda]